MVIFPSAIVMELDSEEISLLEVTSRSDILPLSSRSGILSFLLLRAFMESLSLFFRALFSCFVDTDALLPFDWLFLVDDVGVVLVVVALVVLRVVLLGLVSLRCITRSVRPIVVMRSLLALAVTSSSFDWLPPIIEITELFLVLFLVFFMACFVFMSYVLCLMYNKYRFSFNQCWIFLLLTTLMYGECEFELLLRVDSKLAICWLMLLMCLIEVTHVQPTFKQLIQV